MVSESQTIKQPQIRRPRQKRSLERFEAILDAAERTLIDHEEAHGRRTPVLQVLQSRLEELRGGAAPSGGDPQNAPEVQGTAHGSTVHESTAAEPNTPLRHGVAGQTPSRGRP